MEAQSQEGSEAPAEPAPAAAATATVIRAIDLDRETSVERAPNRLSPAVRRLAAEHNLDVDRIAGTGMGGRVTMMNLCLSFDHRINDGAESGAFMQSVKARLEAMDGDTPIY